MKNTLLKFSVIFVFLFTLFSGSARADWVIDSCQIVIDSGVHVTIDGHFHFSPNTVVLNDGYIYVAGNWKNTGSQLNVAGEVFLIGSYNQTIQGNTVFKRLEIAKNGNVATVSGDIFITDYLVLTSGNINSNNHITLLSNSSKTAIIPGLGSGIMSGRINMQKYMPNALGYHYISSPFPGAPITELADDLNLVTGNPYINNDTTNTVYPFPTVFEYDETYPQPTLSLGWDDPGSNMQTFMGYAANFMDTIMPHTMDIGWTYDHTAPKMIATTHTSSGVPAIDGWNLVGNPYPSSIDWDAPTGWTKNNVANAIYFFRPTTKYQGAYAAYVNGIGTPFSTTGVISPMQGFLVKAMSNGSLQSTNDVRINTQNPLFYKTTPAFPLLRLEAYNNAENSKVDETVIYFEQNASNVFNPDKDAAKLMNTNDVPNLYTRCGNENLSINGLEYPFTLEVIVPLRCAVKNAGTYTINAMEILNFDLHTNIYLEDTELGVLQNLQNDADYEVYLDENSNPNRFFIRFAPAGTSAQNEIANGSINAWSVEKVLYLDLNFKTDSYQVEIFNETGSHVAPVVSKSRGQHTFNLSALATGIYFVRVLYGDKTYVQRFLIQ